MNMLIGNLKRRRVAARWHLIVARFISVIERCGLQAPRSSLRPACHTKKLRHHLAERLVENAPFLIVEIGANGAVESAARGNESLVQLGAGLGRREDRPSFLSRVGAACDQPGLFQASGGSVPLALGVWAVPALVAVLAWLPQWRFRTVPGRPAGLATREGPARLVKVWQHRLAWQVMAFMGLQSLTYYTTLSWLPTLFRDRGAGAVHAGTLLALMNLGNAATALLLPVLAHRTRDQRWLVAATVAATAAGIAGAWFAPLGSAAFWVLLLGLGQGAALGLAIYFTMVRAPDPVASASLSAFAQGAGYLVATAGPLAIGFLHTATGGWTVPIVVLLAVVGGELLSGWLAGRAMTLRA